MNHRHGCSTVNSRESVEQCDKPVRVTVADDWVANSGDQS